MRPIRIDARDQAAGCRFPGHVQPASGRVERLQAHSCRRCHHTAPCHPQVGQRKRRVQLRGVLLQSAAAHLDAAELMFDHPERMFDLRPVAGLDALQLVGELVDPFGLVQPPAFARSHDDVPAHAALGCVLPLGRALLLVAVSPQATVSSSRISALASTTSLTPLVVPRTA